MIMGETFLININCSKILPESDETQYTMLIDSTKMSIVYELVEWIRWMFSLENCFYITHDNYVIHELEDIQVLSKLKNFEVKPCGRSHCVHKKRYRTLLKNLNLFVSWNGIEVHKYFLHKLNRVHPKLTQQNSKTSPTIYTSGNKGHQDFMNDKSTNTDCTKKISPESSMLHFCYDKEPPSLNDSTPLVKRTLTDKTKYGNVESQTELNLSLNKKKLNENFLIQSECKLNYLEASDSTLPENLPPEISNSPLINNTPVELVKNTLKSVQEHGKNSQKSYSKKYVKPFSLGEILSNIREDFEKQNMEMKYKKNSQSPNSIMMEEGNFDEDMTNGKNHFTTEYKISERRKRPRTRRRSKKVNLVKEEISSPYLDTKISASNLDIFKSKTMKPNHIRFDIENDENLMEAEYIEDEQDIQNDSKFEHSSKQMNDVTETESFADEQNIQNKKKFEILKEQISNSTPLTFSKTNPEEFVTVNMNGNKDLIELHQTCSLTNNTENKMEHSSEVDSSTAQENLIHINDSVPNYTNQSSVGTENFESNKSKPELNTLLSLKEKFKNAIVIERFY